MKNAGAQSRARSRQQASERDEDFGFPSRGIGMMTNVDFFRVSGVVYSGDDARLLRPVLRESFGFPLPPSPPSCWFSCLATVSKENVGFMLSVVGTFKSEGKDIL